MRAVNETVSRAASLHVPWAPEAETFGHRIAEDLPTNVRRIPIAVPIIAPCALTEKEDNSHQEAAVLLYSSNTFDLSYDGDYCFTRIRSAIGERNLAHITSLELKLQFGYNFPREELGEYRYFWAKLAQLPGLRDLVVHMRAYEIFHDTGSYSRVRSGWLDAIREFIEKSAVKRVNLYIPRSCALYFRDAESMGIFVLGWGELVSKRDWEWGGRGTVVRYHEPIDST
jgi:hypothetical protein